MEIKYLTFLKNNFLVLNPSRIAIGIMKNGRSTFLTLSLTFTLLLSETHVSPLYIGSIFNVWYLHGFHLIIE